MPTSSSLAVPEVAIMTTTGAITDDRVGIVTGFSDPYLGFLTGGRLNKKDGLTRYGDSHVKDKTS